jgi:ribosomal protein L40E
MTESASFPKSRRGSRVCVIARIQSDTARSSLIRSILLLVFLHWRIRFLPITRGLPSHCHQHENQKPKTNVSFPDKEYERKENAVTEATHVQSQQTSLRTCRKHHFVMTYDNQTRRYFCPICEKDNQPNKKFCRECGAKIPRDSTYCEECGAKLA